MEHRGVCKYGRNCEYLKKGGCKFQHPEINSNSKSSSTKKICKYGNSCPFISTSRGCIFIHPPPLEEIVIPIPNFSYHPEEEVGTLRNFLQTIKGNWKTSFTEKDEYRTTSMALSLSIEIEGPPKSDFNSNEDDRCINGIKFILEHLERRKITNLQNKIDVVTALEECSKHAVRSYYSFGEDSEWSSCPSFQNIQITYGLRPDLWVRFVAHYSAQSKGNNAKPLAPWMVQY